MIQDELRRLADELEQTGRDRAEVTSGPCEDHNGVDCHAAAAFTAWSRAAALVRKRADELAASTAWQWGWRLIGVLPDVVVPASEATARKQSELDPGTEVVRRPVGEWEVVDGG